MVEKLILREFDDMHCHFRKGEILREVVPLTARYAARGVAMPNTRPAVLTGIDVQLYRDEIMGAIGDIGFSPIMTIEIRDDTTPGMIFQAAKAGAKAGKIYPRGVTTNSEEGFADFYSFKAQEKFKAMEYVGMLLLLHGEVNREVNCDGEIFVLDREKAFLPVLECLVGSFPDLRIILEHVSTKEAVRAVKRLGKNVAATITAHHLLLTLNDVVGAGIQPHNGCNPMPKRSEDRNALIVAATSGNPKFFLGSDSAPHPRQNKECAVGACGVFSAPVLPELLAAIFEGAGKLEQLEGFTSRFGAEFYGLPRNEGIITLVKEQWRVPDQIGSVVPFLAGKELSWKLQ